METLLLKFPIVVICVLNLYQIGRIRRFRPGVKKRIPPGSVTLITDNYFKNIDSSGAGA